MMHHILLVSVSYLLVFCSIDTETRKSSNIANKFEDEEDGEEEITAIPPTVISGAHLVCQPTSKDVDAETINISCHFEKDGKILKNIEIEESDFEIHDLNGENLILGSSKNDDGEFNFVVSLREDSEIKISLKAIASDDLAGEEIEQVFSDIIDLEEIEQTEMQSTVPPANEGFNTTEIAQQAESGLPQDDLLAPSPPTNIDDGAYTVLATSSPSISWTASTDAGAGIDSYEISLGTTAGDDSIKTWQKVGNVTSASFDDLNLVSGTVYFVNVRAIDVAGKVSQTSSSDGFVYNFCNALETPGSWILVPGDSDYGTNDFCVMKYEAKNSSGSPSSQSSGTPWVDISQLSAKSECESLGVGYHLITNPEWMTIAANAAGVNKNWSLGSVGSGELARGHSDRSPLQACAADASDTNAYVQDNCDGLASGTFNQRRTHILSTGDVLWDLSGNVYDLVDYYNQNDRPDMPDPLVYAEFNTLTPTVTLPLRDLIPTNEVKSYWDDAWNSSQSIGQYWKGTNVNEGVMLRGAEYDEETAAGLFYAAFDFSPTRTHPDVGFRCTFVQ